MSAKNKKIVQQVNASFGENNVEGFLTLCADDIVWTIVGEKTVAGKDAIRQWLALMDMEAPKFTVAKVIGEGDFVTAYGDMTMKDKTGKTVPYAYCDIYKFRAGKVVELKSFVTKTAPKYETSGAA